MNYFEHHIGDYAEATGHLTFVEDAAYSRMIRKYYAQEKPLPADVKVVQRLVGARTKEEREAVSTVLEEFFTLAGDGWHNARCDAEIEHYKAGEPEREAKKANENNRTQRHRDERAQLFQVLTAAGLHAAWNIGIKELRDMVKALPVTAPVTAPVTRPVTASATPVTATQSPIPNHQAPVIQTNNDNTVVIDPARPLDLADLANPTAAPMPPREDPTPSNDPAIVMSVALRKIGVNALFTHPTVQDWAARNVQMVVLNQAVAMAREQKGDAPIPVNYLAPIVDKLLNPAAPRAAARPAATDLKFHPNNQDRSADAVLMADAMKRLGIEKSTSKEDVEI